jgi:hypothetical protein
VFEVSERSAGTWWRAYRREGREALAVRRVRRSGPQELVSDEERGTLFAAMADYTPEELLIGRPFVGARGGGRAVRAGHRGR